MIYFVGLLIFLGVYVVVSWLLSMKEKTKPVAEVLGIVVGILAALFYVGVIR